MTTEQRNGRERTVAIYEEARPELIRLAEEGKDPSDFLNRFQENKNISYSQLRDLMVLYLAKRYGGVAVA